MALPLSVLDLIPVPSGSTGPQALRNCLDLAQQVDALGYTRYWVAEHHNTGTFASTSPELMIGALARETGRLRVGSGGVMLPNHSPLKVAESFRSLEALHPGRIDLGLGRAPGTDRVTALALRRCADALHADDFAQLLGELLAYAGEAEFSAEHPFARVRAMPDDVPLPPLWLLGSSTYSARMAAAIGRGFSFAYHFAPEQAQQAMRTYREGFQPSEHLARPHAILGVSVVCADTEERAEELALSHDLLWVHIASGRTGPLPSPEEARAWPYSPEDLQQVRKSRAMLVVGTPRRVQAQLESLASQLGADELIVTSHIHDHAARVHSYALLAEAFGLHRGAGAEHAPPA
jgi:luciferase family oxidoreductase group 1